MREFTEADIPKDAPDTESKSPSVRLRSVIYVAWTQQYTTSVERTLNSFDAFYKAIMERITEGVKAKYLKN
jgi:hypothetical protein